MQQTATSSRRPSTGSGAGLAQSRRRSIGAGVTTAPYNPGQETWAAWFVWIDSFLPDSLAFHRTILQSPDGKVKLVCSVAGPESRDMTDAEAQILQHVYFASFMNLQAANAGFGTLNEPAVVQFSLTRAPTTGGLQFSGLVVPDGAKELVRAMKQAMAAGRQRRMSRQSPERRNSNASVSSLRQGR